MPALETQALADQDPPCDSSFEDYPLTRNEYITAVVHYYRGERSRTDAWRGRLDPTTNWAVVTAGGMLSFAFSSHEHSHVTLLLANLFVVMFLGFEARRFRYFDVWRARVRMIEENFFIPIFRRNLISPKKEWREMVAQDLDEPSFKITFLEAVAIRLRFNYIWILLVLFMAWLAKLTLHPGEAQSVAQIRDRMAVGPLSWWVVFGSEAAFLAAALWLAFRGGEHGLVTDEVKGQAKDKEIDQWKT